MTEKTMEAMKKILEKKKAQQVEQQKHRPDKKIGTGQAPKKNQKQGGIKNKV